MQELILFSSNNIFKISNENEEEVALITHYQFFSVLIEKKIYILNTYHYIFIPLCSLNLYLPGFIELAL